MNVKAFFVKLFIFSIPFLVLVSIYFILDPFKVVKKYDSYFDSGKPNYISLNKDYVSTENWINKFKNNQYDSYIFGNSRSIFYQINTWKNYVSADENKCYHFDASGESIFGIAKKIEFLSRQNVKIKNALIVMDDAALNQSENSAGHIFLKHPELSGQNKYSFQVECLKDFFDFKFLTAFLDFKISGKVKDYMKKDFLLDDRPFMYNNVTNEIQQTYFEELINKSPEKYYQPRAAIFYKRDTTHQTIAPAVIKEKQLDLLNRIKEIFIKNGTNYKIVISPLYSQEKLNPKDLQLLKKIFGSEDVFDFSGINKFTNDITNYYETSHYRPLVADEIMELIYTK